MSKQAALAHNLGMLVFGGLSLITAALAFYIFVLQQAPVINIKMKLIDEITWAGGKFRVDFRAERTGYCPSETLYILEDSTGKLFSARADTPRENDIFSVHVPTEMAEGPAVFRQITFYRCNPFRDIIVETPQLALHVVS